MRRGIIFERKQLEDTQGHCIYKTFQFTWDVIFQDSRDYFPNQTNLDGNRTRGN